jgi:hypothetical protein
MPLLGLVLLVWVLARIDAAAVGHALTGASLGAVALCALAFSVNVALKVLRWHRMLVSQHMRFRSRSRPARSSKASSGVRSRSAASVSSTAPRRSPSAGSRSAKRSHPRSSTGCST